MDKIIIALDQATSDTGWAVFENGELKEYGCQSVSGDIETRLIKIRNYCETLFDKYCDKEITFLIEEIQLQSIPGSSKNVSVQTFKKLAWLQGVLIAFFTEKNIDYKVVPSTSWKSTLQIKGKSRAQQKKNAAQFIENNFNIKIKQDTVDAICIGLHYLQKEENYKFNFIFNEENAIVKENKEKMF